MSVSPPLRSALYSIVLAGKHIRNWPTTGQGGFVNTARGAYRISLRDRSGRLPKMLAAKDRTILRHYRGSNRKCRLVCALRMPIQPLATKEWELWRRGFAPPATALTLRLLVFFRSGACDERVSTNHLRRRF